MVGLRFDLFGQPAIGVWLIIVITLALVGLGVFTSGLESRTGRWRAGLKRDVGELMRYLWDQMMSHGPGTDGPDNHP